MDFVTNIFSAFGNINFTVIFQLISLALIVISGPTVIFLLALRGGDL
ncbi:photosystem II reaction center protein Ycf12 [Pleurocapsales cyanobacterium LEGE 10410]|nr:photosystem II reaction center protein Ycf12 [Pleurocapsales cyanobacterium LEGE 10410]